MDDFSLSIAENQFRMICPVNHEQHDRPGTEVKWDIVANLRVRMTIDSKFFHSASFDSGHTYGHSGSRTSDHFPITYKPAVRNDTDQIICVSDVVDLRGFCRYHALTASLKVRTYACD